MISSVLVPLDGSPLSEQALPMAELIAQPLRARIRLAMVHPFPPLPLDPHGRELYVQAELAFRKAESAYVHRMAKDVRDGSPTATGTAYLEGAVGPALRDYVEEIGADMIVMSTHGRGGLNRLWLGSVADYLVRSVDVPILLVRPENQPPTAVSFKPRGILVPLDGSLSAEAVLEPAAEIAKALGAEMTLVQVVRPAAVMSDRPAIFAVDYDEQLATLWRSEAEDYLEDLAEGLREQGIRATSVAVTGYSVHGTLLDLATGESGMMIAMATHGRGGLRRLMVGSVADKLIRTAQVPVLVVRPAKASKRARRPEPPRARRRALRKAPRQPAPQPGR